MTPSPFRNVQAALAFLLENDGPPKARRDVAEFIKIVRQHQRRLQPDHWIWNELENVALVIAGIVARHQRRRSVKIKMDGLDGSKTE